MTTQIVRLARRQAFALAAVLALVLGMIMFAPPAFAQDAEQETGQETFTVSNAELRWGVNAESAGKSNFYGHNFLMAGDAGAKLSGPNQSIDSGKWSRSAGNVRIEKSQGVLATWSDAVPSGNGSSGIEAVFGKGEGTVDFDKRQAIVQWKGTMSVVYYSGLSFFTITDPKLTVDGDSAKLEAILGGVESKQGSDLWNELPSAPGVVVADLSAKTFFSKKGGFSIKPLYEGVKYSGGGQVVNGDFGSFPAGFVDFVSKVGIGPYFYSTGGAADPLKVPSAMTVSWDSDDPTDAQGPGGSNSDKSVLGQVIDDTIEDILRAAGTDVSDTAAAWMDEAWKPLQPDAVNAAKAGAEAAAAAAGATGEVVSQVDSVFEEYYEEYYSAGAPITAGTVAATVASIPASTSRSAAAPASAPAAHSADQVTMQMAATSPLYGSDVVYAQTSASSEAGSSSGQWQWWVGAALLAIAAMLFFQTVRRNN